MVAATIVCPGIKQVIPLAPEPIQNTDGNTKQDCEINAGKRIIKKIRSAHPRLNIIITGDSLYSKQPFIDQLKQNGMSFILVAKPTDHKFLYQCFTEFRHMGETYKIEIKDYKGRRHLYERSEFIIPISVLSKLTTFVNNFSVFIIMFQQIFPCSKTC